MPRKNPKSRTKIENTELSDDKDEKYYKIKESENRMYRMVFAFIMISFMVATYVWFVTSGNNEKSNPNRWKRLRKIKDAHLVFDKEKIKESDHQLHVSNGVEKKNLGRGGPSLQLPSLKALENERNELDQKVREIKASGVIMETDEKSLKLTKALQDVTRKVLKRKYGDHPNYRVKVDLEFQETIPDFKDKGQYGTLVIEMAPIEYVPVSVYNWLEIARSWQSGAFHRNADHVLQATTHARAVRKHLAFQEYSEKYPHKRGTVGYCGRPSGPCWYISILDNTKNHGPGSQQDHNPYEADANFGKIVVGMDDVVPRIHSVPQRGWLDKKNHVFIKKMTILVPAGPGGEFIEWKH